MAWAGYGPRLLHIYGAISVSRPCWHLRTNALFHFHNLYRLLLDLIQRMRLVLDL